LVYFVALSVTPPVAVLTTLFSRPQLALKNAGLGSKVEFVNFSIDVIACQTRLLNILRLVSGAAGRGCYSISPVFLGGATYHLKKTKQLPEAQKEAVCIVKMVPGIELWSRGSGPASILATRAFNNRTRDGTGVVPLRLGTQREKL
jgi:hypothetical protein